jgi:hypothetical protein
LLDLLLFSPVLVPRVRRSRTTPLSFKNAPCSTFAFPPLTRTRSSRKKSGVSEERKEKVKDSIDFSDPLSLSLSRLSQPLIIRGFYILFYSIVYCYVRIFCYRHLKPLRFLRLLYLYEYEGSNLIFTSSKPPISPLLNNKHFQLEWWHKFIIFHSNLN